MTTPAPFKIFKATPPPAPAGRKPIGYRGNHWHKKVLYDPVYPTTKIPAALVPRYPIDWRNGGRALLIAAMSKLENPSSLQRRIFLRENSRDSQTPQAPLSPFQNASTASGGGAYLVSSVGRKRSYVGRIAVSLMARHRQICDYQRVGGFCSPRCFSECSKELRRCLCAWRCNGFHEHVVQMDGMLGEYKGEVKTEKPLFSVLRRQARKNSAPSEGVVFSPSSGAFERVRPAQHAAFEAFDRHGPEGPTQRPAPRREPPLPFYSASHVPDVPRPPPPQPFTGPLEVREDDLQREHSVAESEEESDEEESGRWRRERWGRDEEESDSEEQIRGATGARR
ncbi:conserved hypothetical protein [Neospora caninum Liverpool]|uniref:Uncharacterized protein n=1 Tax=Neospora caninum (strain Liverpool) TaxID=572307 RepID=F0VBC0_NEOCL|nr:conserved hypothetical protein [Neospora caninum Liverpool]CBZ50904.1 conserved hypothetical protein [Neospora caninum Liverpool]CEL68206.1 TPA: hypothetical protein BN1204_039790 [Neospora caninum Liverpool]|eukprot:XP_003880937.1 conserved hypothetical protein [Neospora caninum Liverpool]